MDITVLRTALMGILLLLAVPVMNLKAVKVRLKDLWCMAGCRLASITPFICYFATLPRASIGIAYSFFNSVWGAIVLRNSI